MNFVVTLLPEQHQCSNGDDNDDMTDDHNHRYILDGCDFGYDLQKKKCLLKFTDTVVVLAFVSVYVWGAGGIRLVIIVTRHNVDGFRWVHQDKGLSSLTIMIMLLDDRSRRRGL